MKETFKSEPVAEYNFQAADVTTSPSNGSPVKFDLPAIGGMRLAITGYTMPERQIKSVSDLAAYCLSLNQFDPFESIHAIYCDVQCRIVGESEINYGNIDSCAPDIRKIVTYAILSNASFIFLTHNHPGGTPRPSTEDISATLQIQKALKMLGIRILDHVITTPHGQTYSMAQNGDINFC